MFPRHKYPENDAETRSKIVKINGSDEGCPARRTLLVVSVSLSTQSPVFLTSRCETTELSVLVDWIAEPVDSWVISDCIMRNINENNLVVLIS
jgi:hypothetical protein